MIKKITLDDLISKTGIQVCYSVTLGHIQEELGSKTNKGISLLNGRSDLPSFSSYEKAINEVTSQREVLDLRRFGNLGIIEKILDNKFLSCCLKFSGLYDELYKTKKSFAKAYELICGMQNGLVPSERLPQHFYCTDISVEQSLFVVDQNLMSDSVISEYKVTSIRLEDPIILNEQDDPSITLTVYINSVEESLHKQSSIKFYCDDLSPERYKINQQFGCGQKLAVFRNRNASMTYSKKLISDKQAKLDNCLQSLD